MNILPMPAGLTWLIWLMPLAAFAVITLMRLLPRMRDGSGVAIAVMLGVVGLSAWALLTLLSGQTHEIAAPAFEWLAAGTVRIGFSLVIDPLTAIMLLVVSVVALMVQVYSRGYMHGDRGNNRYFAFLSLFAFAMLGLVLAGNLLLLFICWELVGLCSYLLIGFWFHKPAAAAAAKKAFLVTRIGDVGFLAAILALYATSGTLDISELHLLAAAGAIGGVLLTWICIGLFLGAMGKSAQFPLHVWLPDAMEGPTPVSALIHAATMVAAGVYLVARMYPLFEAAPGMLAGVAFIGGFTALFAATMGLVMTDIKRVLAYSTISQLGFMMAGLAVGGVAVGIFHLFNHAFFKALLFMGAGSLSHAVGTFDMREMGGLRRKLPWTFATFLIGSLSLAGIWPFAGFFSKEEILGSSLEDYPLLFAVLLLTAFMTAFYIFRAIFLAFSGRQRGERRPHESPPAMLAPMVILAALALGSGWLNGNGWFSSFLGHGETQPFIEGFAEILTHPLAWGSLAAALLGILLAYLFYGARRFSSASVRERFAPVHAALKNKYWMDTLYENIIARDLLHRGLFRVLAWFDRTVIDGAVNGLAWLGISGGRAARRLQSGQLQLYGIITLAGIIVLALILVLMR